MNQTKIIHVISSLTRGGRERQLATIYKHSDKQQYPTRILVFNQTRDNYIEEYAISDENLIYLKSKKPYQRLKEIIKILKFEQPDIVYIWGGFEATFCFLASPFINGKMVNGSIRHGKVLFNKKQVWRMILLHFSKYIIANSKQGLHANFIRRGFVLYNGIDEKFISQISENQKIELRIDKIGDFTDQPILISVANLVPYKDYQTIINALLAIHQNGLNFHYFIIGDGPNRKSIQKNINDLGLENKIEILGKIENVEDYLQMGDIFIHSSKGEGCSNAILEAMAAGLPIVATDTGGTKEISGEENGRLFNYKSTEQLTVALEELIGNKNLREKLGKASFDSINSNFTIPKMISNYYKIIGEILN